MVRRTMLLLLLGWRLVPTVGSEINFVPTPIPTVSLPPTILPTPLPSPAPTPDPNKFICFGGRNQCPDEGLQTQNRLTEDYYWRRSGSAAGAYYLKIEEARYLPAGLDLEGISLEADPYVKATVFRETRSCT